MILKWVLFCYEMWSGLKINFQKIFLIFLGDILINNLLLSRVFSCPVQRLSVTYLGLSISLGVLKKSWWRPLIDTVQKRLVGWKVKLLSLWESITMINMVLSAILTYFLSFFPILRWVEKNIEPMRRKFLWNRAHKDGNEFCLVNWKRVSKYKEFGLRIINIRDFNTTFFFQMVAKII